jgi:Zn-dependent alcohol dehydrogenase
LKAAVCYAFNEPLVVEDIEIAAPREGEVLVRLAATAICHSDIHLLSGDWLGALPVVAGHEAAGVVEAIGANVTAVQPGDRVVISLLRSCGRCFHCSTGATHNCDGAFALDRKCRLRNAGGQDLQQGIKVGAFAEKAIVDQSQLVKIPDAMPLEAAALLGCGVITGTGAVMNTARVAAGESVVVIGTGGVGLNAIQAAVLAGANPIIAMDRVESKLESARQFGATHVAADAKEVRKITGGRGVDYAFVTVGVADLMPKALTMIRRGGTVVVIGMPGVRDTAAVRVFDVVWSEQRIIGSRMGSTRLQVDVPRLADLYLRGQLKLDELITGRYDLAGINEAIASMRSGSSLRNVITFPLD